MLDLMQLVCTTWIVGWAPVWWKTLHTLRVLELGITFNLSDRSSRFCDEGKPGFQESLHLARGGKSGTDGCSQVVWKEPLDSAFIRFVGLRVGFLQCGIKITNHTRKKQPTARTPCPDTHFTPSYLALLKPDWTCVILFFLPPLAEALGVSNLQQHLLLSLKLASTWSQVREVAENCYSSTFVLILLQVTLPS